jgi:hypothetical protein
LKIKRAKERMGGGGRWPLCKELENATQMLTKRWRYQFLSAEWLEISEKVAYKKLIGYNNVNKLRGLEMYLYRASCRWEKEISNHGERMEDEGGS